MVLEACKAVEGMDDPLVESVYNKLKALGLTEEELQKTVIKLARQLGRGEVHAQWHHASIKCVC
jgi:hypothetical protein